MAHRHPWIRLPRIVAFRTQHHYARAMLRSSSAWTSLAVAVLTLAFVACSSPRDEGLIVNVQTDFVPLVEFDAIRVRVDDGAPREIGVTALGRFGRPSFVTSFDGVLPGRRTLSVTLVQRGRLLTTRRIEFPFQGTYLATVVLTRSCTGLVCRADESCLGERCVPATCIDGTEPSCPPPTCRTDSECTASTPCVAASCVTGACFELPDDGRCPANDVCVPAMGCVARVAEADAWTASVDAFVPPVDTYTPPPEPDAWVAICNEGLVQGCTSGCGSSGFQTCSSGLWGVCVPPNETCNGLDDNCDTLPDNGAICSPGEVCRHGGCAPCDVLGSGEFLYPAETLGCGWFTLTHQGDGNVVLENGGGLTLWNSMTNGRGTSVLQMQADGNLVLLDSAGSPIWSTATDGNPGAQLTIRSEGFLQIRNAGGVVVWSNCPAVPMCRV